MHALAHLHCIDFLGSVAVAERTSWLKATPDLLGSNDDLLKFGEDNNTGQSDSPTRTAATGEDNILDEV